MHRAKALLITVLIFSSPPFLLFSVLAATAIPGSVEFNSLAAGIYIAKYCFAARSLKTLVMAFLLLSHQI